ncbi:MAG: hypothetical protein ACKOU6_01535 [Planctomycetota bacterium]
MSRSRKLVKWYVLSVSLAFLVLVVVNWLGNGGGILPSPLVPCLSDRSWKARRLEEMVAAGRSPEIVLFGSSYVMQFQPSYLKERTGVEAFNFGVSMGRPVDALTLLRHARQVGVRPQRVIAAFHQEAFDAGLAAGTTRLADYGPLLRQTPFPVNLQILAERFGNARIWNTRQSINNLLGRNQATRSLADVDSLLLADGYLIYTKTTLARHNGTFDLEQALAKKNAATDPDPAPLSNLEQSAQFAYLEQFLRLSRVDAAQVQLVLMPKHPAVITAYNRSHREIVVERLKAICGAVDCEFYDLDSVSLYAGDLAEFHDAGHQSPVNTRRIINLLLGERVEDDATQSPTDWEILNHLPAVTTLTTP